MSALRLVTVAMPATLLAGCLDLPPKGTSADNVAAYDAAVSSLGCVLVSDADYGAVEFQAGISRAQALAITEQRLAREQAVRLEGGGVRLTGGACAA